MRMMRPGISTACLYPMEIERSLDLLLSMDFKLYEFFLNTWSELTPSFLRLLRDRLESAGAQVKSIHPFTSAIEGMLFFSEYLRRMEDDRWYYPLIAAAVQGVLGAVILANPFGTAMVLMRFIGASLVVEGICELVFSLLVRRRRASYFPSHEE